MCKLNYNGKPLQQGDKIDGYECSFVTRVMILHLSTTINPDFTTHNRIQIRNSLTNAEITVKKITPFRVYFDLWNGLDYNHFQRSVSKFYFADILKINADEEKYTDYICDLINKKRRKLRLARIDFKNNRLV